MHWMAAPGAWSFELKEETEWTNRLVASENSLYVATGTGRVLRLTGDTASETRLDVTAPVADMTAIGREVYLADEDTVYALDEAMEVTWTFEIESRVASIPATNNVVLYVSWDDELVGIDADSGTVTWRRSMPLSNGVVGIRNGRGYCSTGDRLVAFSLSDGTTLWEREFAGSVSSPAVTADKLFVWLSDPEGDLAVGAFSAATGAHQWRVTVDSTRPLTGVRPRVTGERVYLMTAHGVIGIDRGERQITERELFGDNYHTIGGPSVITNDVLLVYARFFEPGRDYIHGITA